MSQENILFNLEQVMMLFSLAREGYVEEMDNTIDISEWINMISSHEVKTHSFDEAIEIIKNKK